MAYIKLSKDVISLEIPFVNDLGGQQWSGSKLEKEYIKTVYCHLTYLTYMESTSYEMPGWMKHKLESRLPGELSITSDMAETEEGLKILLMKVKEESEKAALKFSVQKMKIIAFSPIISWQLDGGTTETVTHFTFLGSKITAHGNCSHEIKRWLLLGRKAMTNLDSILKSRGIT